MRLFCTKNASKKAEYFLNIRKILLRLVINHGFTVLEGPKLVVKLCSHVIVS